MRFIVAAAVLAGCGTTGGFDYKATIDLDPTDLTLDSVTIDGTAVTTPFYTLEHSFPSYELSSATIDTVVVATNEGSFSFSLSASPCGNVENCDPEGDPPCSNLTAESETWDLFDQSQPGKPYIAFYPDEGHCTFSDGTDLSWGD